MILLKKICETLNRILLIFAGFFLIGMILLTCSNIVLRLVWVPILGTYELMGYFGAVSTAFALAYTQTKKGHIAVDILVNIFSEKAKIVITFINNCLCLIFFLIVTWQVGLKGMVLLKTGEVTESLKIIYYPFTFAVALGCGLLSLVFIIDLISAIVHKKETPS